MVRLGFDREAFRIQLTPVTSEGRPGPRKTAPDVVPIAHKTPMCPAFAYEAAQHQRKDLSLRVGVAVLVESADGKILLTRRPQRLRSFGGLYVLPGGNLERGESLVEAGLREVREETGLDVVNATDVRPFCLWESTFPLSFDESQGRNGLSHQHLVVYVHVRASHVHSADPRPFRPQVSEISELVWVSRTEAAMLLEETEEVDSERRIKAFVPDEAEFDPDNWHHQVQVHPESTQDVPLQQLRENVVIGTQFAIRTLLGASAEAKHDESVLRQASL
ncbi:Nucleoside diphosphate-linked moiety X motif 17 [Hondaea fermentalgiana]|uniref:Nucleoside diphosphate-linked moiety X motif 17 n=1 Tax=Hondaea fermentalgiana TaxID=2315210 RepID=A0A2R5GUF6_9STRA|nr:Nucleoside diphosphate-linked moiety X motif 17 [Hondaea fermentalgiana]|eukprot:GBG32293.1 Nucleoside diphosphate-linked moiety X motif 17 [Hondaea fermentalgiana]